MLLETLRMGFIEISSAFSSVIYQKLLKVLDRMLGGGCVAQLVRAIIYITNKKVGGLIPNPG